MGVSGLVDIKETGETVISGHHKVKLLPLQCSVIIF
jgi:hypothetical protein